MQQGWAWDRQMQRLGFAWRAAIVFLALWCVGRQPALLWTALCATAPSVTAPRLHPRPVPLTATPFLLYPQTHSLLE